MEGGGVRIDTQSAGFSVRLTSSPVELGISGRVSVGEDGRAGEGRVGQSRRQSLVTLFCRAEAVVGKEEKERQERSVISIVSLHFHCIKERGSALWLSSERPEPLRCIINSSRLNNVDFMRNFVRNVTHNVQKRSAGFLPSTPLRRVSRLAVSPLPQILLHSYL